MITDILRSFVDHDRPFHGPGIVRERLESLMDLQLANAEAIAWGDGRRSSSILKDPMFSRDGR